MAGFLSDAPVHPLVARYALAADPIGELPESAQERARVMARMLASIDVSTVTPAQRGELLALLQAGQYNEMLSRINMPGLHTIRGAFDAMDRGAQGLVGASGLADEWNGSVRSTYVGGALHVAERGSNLLNGLVSLPSDAATLAAAGIGQLLNSGQTSFTEMDAARIAAMTEGAYVMYTPSTPGFLTRISAAMTFVMENYLPTWLGGAESPRSWDVILNSAMRDAASPVVRRELIATGEVSEAIAGLMTSGGQAVVNGQLQDIAPNPEGVTQGVAAAPLVPTSADEARANLTALGDSASEFAAATGGYLSMLYDRITADDRSQTQRIYDGLPRRAPEEASPIVREAIELRRAIEGETRYFNVGTVVRSLPFVGFMEGGRMERAITEASRPAQLLNRFQALRDRALEQGGYYDLLVASRVIDGDSDRVNRAVAAGLPAASTADMPESVIRLIESRRVLAESAGIDLASGDFIAELHARGHGRDADAFLRAVEEVRQSDPQADVMLTRLVNAEPAWGVFDGERNRTNYAHAQSEEYTFGELRAALADPASPVRDQLQERFGAEFDAARQRVIDQYVADYGSEPEAWELTELMRQSPDFSTRGDYYSVSLLERDQFIATRITELSGQGGSELGTFWNDAEPSGVRRLPETAVQPDAPAVTEGASVAALSVDGGLYAAAVDAEARRAAAALRAAEMTGGDTVEGASRPEVTAMVGGQPQPVRQ